MRKITAFSLLFIILVFTLHAADFGNKSSATNDGILTPEIISEIQKSLKIDPSTRALMNALCENNIRDLVKDQDVRDNIDFIFSHEIDIKGMTNQKQSGRCWLYASTNIHRQNTTEKFNIDKFEFSQNYSMFWDKLEKANLFLEYMIMNPTIETNDREFVLLLKTPLPDGGFYHMSADVIMKYGAVPKEIMPETVNSSSTGRMNQMIQRKLRIFAFELRDMYKGKKSIKKMRDRKVEMLKEVYRMLSINLGLPPSEFEWRYVDKDGIKAEVKTYTPQSFWQEAVGIDLHDYAVIGNCPTQPFGKNYRIKLGRGQLEGTDWTFLNLEMDELKEYARAVLSDTIPIQFSCDMGKQVDSKPGYMVNGIYNYSSFYGLDFDFSKVLGILARESAPNHAMALVGYDEEDGKVLKWKVENSWGKDRGEDGFFVMSDEWFGSYGYSVVVPMSYLKPEHKKLIEDKPVVLPFWDPLAGIAQVGGYSD